MQRQVVKAETFAKSAIVAVPGVLWEGAKRVGKAVAAQQQAGSGDDVRKVVRETADELGDAVEDAADAAKRAADGVSKAPKTDGK